MLVGFGLLVVSQLILQFWEEPTVRLLLGALGLIGWDWLMTGLLASDTPTRRVAGLGVIGGLVLDLAVRISAGTVDLPWMPGVGADATTVALCIGALLIVLNLGRSASELSPAHRDEASSSTVSLIGVGGGLALFLLLSGNLGLISQKLDSSLPASAALVVLGALLGLGLSCLAVILIECNDRRSILTAIGLNVALVVIGNWLTQQAGISRAFTALGFILVTSGGLSLLIWSLLGRQKRGRVRLAGHHLGRRRDVGVGSACHRH